MANRVLRDQRKWWVLMDWADAHMVRMADEQPDLEWEGPFDSFTAMRKAIVESGVIEAANIHNQLREWRTKRKSEALSGPLHSPVDWSQEVV